MTWFVQATDAMKPRSKNAGAIAVLLAGIMVLFAVAQLFTFDEFTALVATFQLPFGAAGVAAFAPLLVAAEVFSIPFLLRMKVSPAFRWASMGLGWLVSLAWIFVTLWLVVKHVPATSVGFIGTVGELSPGWWAVAVSLALAVLVVWASWGLWPGVRSSRAVKR